MRAVADGVWQLTGFPPDAINVYLAGDVLIDTATRWARPRILRQLRGRRPALIALTHCHPDHIGSAKSLCGHFRAPLACHADDVDAAEGRRPMLKRKSRLDVGLPFMAALPCRVGRVLRDGDEVAGFRVVHAPGHTPGHVFFFRESDRVCLAGDVIANVHMLTGRPGLHEPPRAFSHDPALNRASMRKLVELRPSLVCFGHGPPLRDTKGLEEFVATMR